MGLTSKKIKESTTFKEIKKTKNQEDYYRENNVSPEILKLVKMGNRKFGGIIEKLLIEYFDLSPSKNGSTDFSYGDLLGEIKASRFWVNTESFKWQHLMMDIEYDIILLGAVNFDGIDVYALTKRRMIELHEKGIIKRQGSGESQGLWFTFDQVKNDLIKISSKKDLDNYIEESFEMDMVLGY